MSVVTQMVLLLTGQFKTSLPPGEVVISRVDCVSRCYWDPQCLSVFYNTEDRTCMLVDSVYSLNDMDSSVPNMQYLVWQPERRDCRLDYSLASSLGMCYRVYSTSSTWQMALNQCHQDGGHLLKADSGNITEFFNTFTCGEPSRRFWVGGHFNNDTWQWGDNSGFIWEHDDDDDNDPIYANETCMQMKCDNSETKLEDKNCELPYRYICETAVLKHFGEC